MRKLFVLCLLLVATSASADDYEIWNGFSFTPGAGLRHLGLDITRKSDGFTGNIAQDVPAKVFFTFNIESPKYRFDNSNWGVSIVNYNSFVTVDYQWYDYTGGSSSTDGERIDVGTEISGRYSYLLPQVFYEIGRPGHSSFKFALGFGIWNANLSGTIKLTPGNQPTVLTPSSDINIKTSKLGYLMTMSYRTETNWIWEMSLGGIDFGDAEYDYKVEEVTLTIGKRFML